MNFIEIEYSRKILKFRKGKDVSFFLNLFFTFKLLYSSLSGRGGWGVVVVVFFDKYGGISYFCVCIGSVGMLVLRDVWSIPLPSTNNSAVLLVAVTLNFNKIPYVEIQN